MLNICPENQLKILNAQANILELLIGAMDALKVISDAAGSIKDELKNMSAAAGIARESDERPD